MIRFWRGGNDAERIAFVEFRLLQKNYLTIVSNLMLSLILLALMGCDNAPGSQVGDGEGTVKLFAKTRIEV